MSKLLSILLAGAAVCGAATYTVCASGCTYSNLQTALNAAGHGDILELKAGEIFEGSFVLPYKTGLGAITVRSSRWRELPSPGTRVTAASAAIMPTLQPNNASDPVVIAGFYEQYVSSVSTTTDTILFSGSHGFSDRDPVACFYEGGTIPIVQNQIYYVRDATSNTVKLSAAPNGPALDLITASTATTFRCTLARSVNGWTFQGIEFRSKPGQDTQYNLLQIGTGQATTRAGLVNDIEFDRVYIHGIDGEEGPNVCVYAETNAITITDSRIEFCKRGGNESKAISFPQVAGPALVRNNYIDGAAINLLVGGEYMRIDGMISGDGGGMIFEGNHFFKPMSYKWSAVTGGSSNPVGACSDGNKYLNTSSGAWFQCSGSTWASGPTCANGEYFKRTDVTQNCASGACWSCASGVFAASSVYRQYGYAVKNLFELKSAINIIIRGNVFENNWIDGQDGLAVLIIAVGDGYNTAGWARGENIRFERNIVRNSAQGVRISSSNSVLLLRRNNQISMTDNLIYKIGNTDYPSINSTSARPLSFGGPCDDCAIDHNTIVSGVTGGQGIYFDTAPFVRPRLSNSILYANLYGMIGDGGLPISHYWGGDGNVLNTVMVDNLGGYGAPSSFGSYAVNGKYITAATPLFTGSGNYRLLPTSPYSASCTTGCDFSATDGKDLGADIDAVEAATDGVTGSGSTVARMRIQVETGSRHAIVRYQAPTAAACSLSLFTNAARTVLHADTPDAGTQSDARAGNIVDGRRHEFVLGAVAFLTPSTLYQARLDCGSLRIPISVRTAASGANAPHTLRFAQPATVRYANNLSFTGATTLAAATRHEIPVPSGGVVYVQTESLPATAVAGR